MPKIVLSTINAKYIHASFGLRYLHANLGPLQERAEIREFEIKQRPLEIAERLLDGYPGIIGMGVYIWNATLSHEVAAIVKRLRPDVILVLGGPEVSHETDAQAICGLADYIITGEADLAFAELCEALVRGERPVQRITAAGYPDVTAIRLPYSLYTAADIAHRVLYVEASRGCPFRCEFCLSSLEIPVRQFPLPALLSELEQLIARGARQFKFVDRTFNLSIPASTAILNFFLERMEPGIFVHFEMVPDRLPLELREIIRQFPAGSLQFEVGVQTFNPEVADRISRRQNYQRLEDNLRYIRDHTGVHVHADLIAGLPGETLESFGEGFNKLLSLRPQEIQVGILKRLRGTPICRHDKDWGMIYAPNAPYEILQNSLLDFVTMQRLRRFARYWDIIYNSGTFVLTSPLIWGEDPPFAEFLRFSNWLYGQTRRTDAISLTNLFELIHTYLVNGKGLDSLQVQEAMLADHRRAGRTDTPRFLRISEEPVRSLGNQNRMRRQARHLGTATGNASSGSVEVKSSPISPL